MGRGVTGARPGCEGKIPADVRHLEPLLSAHAASHGSWPTRWRRSARVESRIGPAQSAEAYLFQQGRPGPQGPLPRGCYTGMICDASAMATFRGGGWSSHWNPPEVTAAIHGLINVRDATIDGDTAGSAR